MPRAKGSAADARIGARLRRFREGRGITQSDLGAALGITYQQVQKYEAGKDRMTVATLLRSVQMLDVAIECFFAGLGQRAKGAERDARSLENSDALRLFAAIEDTAARRRLLTLMKRLASQRK